MSIYPDVLNIHKIIPIPKEAIAITLDKYRSIAVLSTIDKIFEKNIRGLPFIFRDLATLVLQSNNRQLYRKV